MLQDRQRAGARWNLGIGAQHCEIGLLAVELRERLGIVGIERDLQAQPRGGVLENRGELGGKHRLIALGVANSDGQRLGVSQPDAAASHRRNGQDQGQQRK